MPNLKLLEMSMQRLYLEDGQAHRQHCWFILLACFAIGDPSLQDLGRSVLPFRELLQQAGDRNGDTVEELGRKCTSV